MCLDIIYKSAAAAAVRISGTYVVRCCTLCCVLFIVVKVRVINMGERS